MSSPVRPLRQGGSGCAADVLRQVHGQLPGPVRKECGPDYSGGVQGEARLLPEERGGGGRLHAREPPHAGRVE